jgi:cellulose synthase operon protein C
MQFPTLWSLRAAACALTVLAAHAQDAAQALAALKSGAWKQAVEIASAVPAESADRHKANYICGEAQLVLGDLAGAEASFRAVLERNPAAVPAQIGLGRVLTASAKHEEAEKLLESAAKADAKDPAAACALGLLYLRTERLPKARELVAAAYDIAPKDPLVARAWCEVLWALKDEAKAAQVAASLTRALPKHPMGPFLAGIAHERDKKDRKAIDAYEEALARDASFLDAHKNLAIVCHTANAVYMDTVRTKKAMEHYKAYFDLGGQDPELKHVYETTKGFMEKYFGIK